MGQHSEGGNASGPPEPARTSLSLSLYLDCKASSVRAPWCVQDRGRGRWMGVAGEDERTSRRAPGGGGKGCTAHSIFFLSHRPRAPLPPLLHTTISPALEDLVTLFLAPPDLPLPRPDMFMS